MATKHIPIKLFKSSPVIAYINWIHPGSGQPHTITGYSNNPLLPIEEQEFVFKSPCPSTHYNWVTTSSSDKGYNATIISCKKMRTDTGKVYYKIIVKII